MVHHFPQILVAGKWQRLDLSSGLTPKHHLFPSLLSSRVNGLKQLTFHINREF